jgi:hypothetical protein
VQDQGNLRLYARGANGHLYEDHAPSGSYWTGLWDMGGALF